MEQNRLEADKLDELSLMTDQEYRRVIGLNGEDIDITLDGEPVTAPLGTVSHSPWPVLGPKLDDDPTFGCYSASSSEKKAPVKQIYETAEPWSELGVTDQISSKQPSAIAVKPLFFPSSPPATVSGTYSGEHSTNICVTQISQRTPVFGLWHIH